MLNAAIERLVSLVNVGAVKFSTALVSPNLKLMENYVKEVNTFHGNNKMSVIGISRRTTVTMQ
ncbi:hypothetical protein PPTG_24961 [Phytophthora nicotianae INRA-310]|uniref:Uncharacterized protein n=1 Tax=Phytophthora nicotianae (strain INRA-310) TaxID=761204 RepID=W2P9B8_PHYN3|nr:hypothetical protein PPTG_24961 [Phytophthora nicotianae INRA-310]ETM97416.1 hypothetical protein PPTG_24961 [Phytophthora nicotianae INRA-310]